VRPSAVLVLLAALPALAMAQREEARAAIDGRVVGPDSVPLAGVDVVIVGSRFHALTDRDGRFRLNAIHPGRYELLFRRLGYEQRTRFVTLRPGEVNDMRVEMRRLPEHLEAVTIAGKRHDVLPRYQGLYRRAAVGFGTYIFGDDFARRMPLDVFTMLEGIPGVTVRSQDRNTPLEIARCREIGRMPSPAGIGSVPVSTARTIGTAQNATKIQVYIDGQLATSVGSIFDALTSVHPNSVYAIEVYRGVAQIPAEFLADACAVIAIWTR